jgi:DNA-binding NtrC family response regulator
MKAMLIVDDDRGSRESLRQTFMGLYQMRLAENAAQALQALAEQMADVVLLDVMMPEKDGVTLLREINDLYPGLSCIMVSASPSVRPVVESIKAGACDFVLKPFDVAEIRRIVARVVENNSLRRQVEILQTEVARDYPAENIIGRSPALLTVLETVQQAAQSDATVLIQGESGTGKELIARRLHLLSQRADEPFTPVHCSALPETLMESELFGHEKGSFTGADARKLGRFDLAGAGSLFFDEVGEMSLSIQVKLLRVLQEREYMRVGGTQVIKTRARIITATSRILEDEVRQHRFRDDLYYRLNVVPIVLPPLRDRPGDVPLLIRHFLQSLKRSMNCLSRDFSPEAMDLLSHYSWPGNIRELRNVVERTLVIHGSCEMILPEHLPDFSGRNPAPLPSLNLAAGSLETSVASYERTLILTALKESRGVQTRAARLLGTTRRILAYKMQKLNLRGQALPGTGIP